MLDLILFLINSDDIFNLNADEKILFILGAIILMILIVLTFIFIFLLMARVKRIEKLQAEILSSKKIALNYALRSAISAIMARNMSHNIGSHVLSYLSNPDELENLWILKK